MKKRIPQLLLFSLCFLLSFEMGARIFVHYKHWAPRGLHEAYSAFATSENTQKDDSQRADRYADIFQPHFFWGFRFVTGNNHGFLDPEDFPYTKKPNELVIGIFGGSTAMHWTEWIQKNNGIPEKNGKRVKVLNLSLSGMRQPQQYAVASRFMDTLDIAIFYDGFNEAVFDECPLDPITPYQFNLLAHVDTNLEVIDEIRYQTKKLRLSALAIRDSWLGHSAAVFLSWRALAGTTGEKITDLLSQQVKSKHKDQFPDCDLKKSERNFQNWRKYTELSQKIAEYFKVPALHLLQIDPFKNAHRALSEKEKIIVRWDDSAFVKGGSKGIDTQEFYDLYLKAKPPYSYDLTELFDEHTETLYIDEHSHLTGRGYEILTEELLRILKQQNLLD